MSGCVVPDQLEVAEDRGQRCSELVRNDRDELVLEPVELAQALVLLGQGATFHLGLSSPPGDLEQQDDSDRTRPPSRSASHGAAPERPPTSPPLDPTTRVAVSLPSRICSLGLRRGGDMHECTRCDGEVEDRHQGVADPFNAP